MGLTKKGAIRRGAILESARQAFTQSGYDVGLREITTNAGVTAMMVKRYFWSKEEMFREVADIVLPILAQEIAGAPDRRALCHNIAVAFLSEPVPDETPMDGILIMLRSMNNEVATRILCKKFETHCGRALPKFLPGSGAQQRGAIFLSVIASFQAMHRINRQMPLTKDHPGALAERLESLFRLLTSDTT